VHALLSVSDKQGLVPFAQSLVQLGFTLLSTGGTQAALEKAGVPVTAVSEHTRSPEFLGGRVKTLHPRIHGGILARRNNDADLAELKREDIPTIDLVAVNLYPFRQTVASGAPFDDVVEQIDIGGPSMVRAAAKNAAHVTVVVDPSDYSRVVDVLREGGAEGLAALRRELMVKAFAHTASYDAAIASYLQSELTSEPFAEHLTLGFEKELSLRYGENPHQRAAFYREPRIPEAPTVAFSEVLQGKALSYNNLLDLDAALALVLEFPESPAAVVIKHNTPCGVARADSLLEAYRAAHAVDPVSAFGGIVAFNREVDAEVAEALAEIFLEAVIAPSFTDGAREVLAAKKNLRLLAAGARLARADARPGQTLELRSISGGLLVQDRDALEPETEWKVVTKRAPTPDEDRAMRFAWRICKHVKSNAIVHAGPNVLLASGGGQTSRVDAAKIAAARGGEALRGSAVASDAFFPFRDGLDVVVEAGATCVVQPGGSVRDAEVIEAADAHGIAMVFTGTRHFRH
jgi:phosphoribosylaminoimidazolecarboxamide formyltransferase/IMP cyclohydrolase